MKKKMKQAISLLLTLIMIFSCCQFSTFAANYAQSQAYAVGIETDKSDYADGEEIKITVNHPSLKETESYVMVVTSPYMIINNSLVINNVLINNITLREHDFDSNGKAEITAIADRTPSEDSSMQLLYDIIFGYAFTVIYKFLDFLYARCSSVTVNIDGIPCIIYCRSFVGVPSDEDEPLIDDVGDYSVTFDLNYEGAPESIVNKTTKNNAIVYPEQPQREDFVFLGWYLDSSCETEYTSTDALTEDLVLYASWLDLSDKTDTDGDGLIDALEDYIGTDKNKTDTDDDELTDYEEYASVGTDPLDSDSDDNGVLDGADDPDNDKLTNRQELDNSTAVYSADTDADYLSDYDEIFTYSTDPTKADTDEDGLWDGDEIAYKMDPNDSDTLDDGILDGDRTFTITATSDYYEEGDAVKPEIEIELSGEQIETLSIEKVSESDMFLSEEIPGYIGNAYDFNVEGTFEEATLSFEVPEELFEDEEFVPAIYYFNESRQCLEELENQTVEGNVVSAPITHFSKYIVLAKDKYEKELFEFEIEAEDKSNVHLTFLIDLHNQIESWTEPVGRWEAAEQLADSAMTIINGLRDDDMVSVLVMAGSGDQSGVYGLCLNANKTEAYDTVKYYIKEGAFGGGGSHTHLLDGLAQAVDINITNTNNIPNYLEETKNVVIVYASGEDKASVAGAIVGPERIIKTANNYNVTYHTVGVGRHLAAQPDVVTDNLSPFATRTGGTHCLSLYSQLPGNTVRLAQEVEDSRMDVGDANADTDGDGISDYHEKKIAKGELKLGTGIAMEDFEKLDYKNPDSDGDGIKDGDELKIKSQEINKERVYYCTMTSNPCMVDSDYDGYLDDVTGEITSKEKNVEKDKNPLVWDVSDRDLAMFSSIIYADNIHSLLGQDLSKATGVPKTSVDAHFLGTAGYEELKGWKLIAVYDKGVMEGNYKKKNDFLWLEFETEVKIPNELRFGIFVKDDNAVVAYRGSTPTSDDWINNLVRYGILGNDPGIPAVRASVSNVFNNITGVNRKIYITGHSRGGMLAQNAAAEAVLQGYGGKITSLTYFNGIGVDMPTRFGSNEVLEMDEFLNRLYHNTMEPLLLISSKIRRHYVNGDVVDCVGWHAAGRAKTVPISVAALTKNGGLDNFQFYKAHRLCNFTEVYMPERYQRAMGKLPK